MIRTSVALGTALSILVFAASAAADEGAPAASSSDEAPNPQAPQAQAAEQAKPEEPQTLLRVESSRIVAIENADTGEVVCTSPCNVKVPAAGRYRVGGTRGSKPFVLDSKKGRANITVDAATQRGFVTGLAVGGAGVLVAGAGATILAIATANRGDVPGRDGALTDTGTTDGYWAGLVMITSGIALGIWGTANVLNNLKTSVSGDVQKAPPARGDAPTQRQRASAEMTPPPALFVPILRGTF